MFHVSHALMGPMLVFLIAPIAAAKDTSGDFSMLFIQQEGCGTAYVEQDPHPFLTNVKREKVKGSVRLRVDSILESFPDDVSLKVYFRATSNLLLTTTRQKACESFDGSSLKFVSVWKKKSS